MKLRVLGSAAGGGFPQWNCNCPQCLGVRQQSIRATPRTQSSIVISDDGVDWVLFNASPDILKQLQDNPDLQPARRLRDTGIRSVVLMDGQIDHTTGLYMLREHGQALDIWCTKPVHEDLTQGYPVFKVLDHYCGVNWHELTMGQSSVRIAGAQTIKLTALPLISNAPPYSPHRDKPVEGDTIGMLMHDTSTDKKLFYAPGLGEMQDNVWQAMNEADCVLIDGTMWTDDEMIATGASAKTAKSMGHMPLSGEGGTLHWLKQLPSTTRKVLIHINNTNPILNDDSSQRAELDKLSIELAVDGMSIDI